ncbi:MAG: phytanoyl-CoA dioxygenase family protein [Planctomycetes bacterium]|nr:phytanoyl-CoA dioxygenase family protein [Planctomycetota bacterium]
MVQGSADALQFARDLPVEAGELIEAWRAPDRLSRWLHLMPDLAPRRAAADESGFELEYELPGQQVAKLRGRCREHVPARRLAFDLETALPTGIGHTRVTFAVQPDGATTKVRLEHEGLDEAGRPQAKAAWQHSLGLLIAACPGALDTYFGRFRRAAGYRSQFGGLWPDAPDFAERLARKRAAGELDAVDEERFRAWDRDGFVRIERAVPESVVDALREEIAADWKHGNPKVTVELNDGSHSFPRMAPQFEHLPHKVLDYHSVSVNARAVQFSPPIRRFLSQLFERPPMSFQSLLFRYGTEQEMHQDTAYVVVRSPMEFVGVWVALEDIAPGTGELQYYGGSHRIPEYLWLDRGRSCPPSYGDHRSFLAWVRNQSEQRGCPMLRFHPKKGDALVWHADLVHGGSRRELRDRTRWSFVTHYCPVDVDPEWMARVAHSGRLEHEPGAFYCYARRPGG